MPHLAFGGGSPKVYQTQYCYFRRAADRHHHTAEKKPGAKTNERDRHRPNHPTGRSGERASSPRLALQRERLESLSELGLGHVANHEPQLCGSKRRHRADVETPIVVAVNMLDFDRRADDQVSAEGLTDRRAEHTETALILSACRVRTCRGC